MSKIKITNFGPIKSGLEENNGWIEIRKVTILTGNQGSGKSTVAKLISTISWIEKALVRGDLAWTEFDQRGRFEEFCAYQNISDYFLKNTTIKYEGHSIIFDYSQGMVKLFETNKKNYLLPKIMYVPAERNFLGAVPNISNIKDLPSTLYTFSDEYKKALREIRSRVKLPINDVFFEYNSVIDIPAIGTDDYLLDLSRASSGFQSSVPLFLVTRYLADIVKTDRNQKAHHSQGILTLQQEDRIRKEIAEIRDNPNLNETVKRLEIERISSKFQYSLFLNIVEEPEQNLHPTSQREVLNSLLEYNNSTRLNELLITTHSPYLINYLTLAIKAKLVFARAKDDDTRSAINTIVPQEATVESYDVIIYELDTSGNIKILPTYNGMPSDGNVLNEQLDEFNELYAQLVELDTRSK